MAKIIYSPSLGIYLGNFLDLHLWAAADRLGIPVAPTFASTPQALDDMRGWNAGVPTDFELRDVTPDADDHASIAACVAAGIPDWRGRLVGDSLANAPIAPFEAAASARLAAIAAKLADHGYGMAASLGEIDGDGAPVINLATGEPVEDERELPAALLAMAEEWTVLTNPHVDHISDRSTCPRMF